MGDPAIRRLVLSRPIPERLIESLGVAPDVPPHEIEMWTRCGGRITNLLPRSRPNRPQPHVRQPPTRLARRELEAIRLIASGLTNKQVAARMGLRASSLEMTLAQARYRLDRSRTNERAVLVACARGLVELPAGDRAADRLSPTESQALAMYWHGARKSEIAQALDVAADSAASYLKAARRKLGATTTAEAARLAFG